MGKQTWLCLFFCQWHIVTHHSLFSCIGSKLKVCWYSCCYWIFCGDSICSYFRWYILLVVSVVVKFLFCKTDALTLLQTTYTLFLKLFYDLCMVQDAPILFLLSSASFLFNFSTWMYVWCPLLHAIFGHGYHWIIMLMYLFISSTDIYN
jgi:hypothetical protein